MHDPGPLSVQAALVLTDIVDSTGLSEQLGDVAMSALWAQHDRASRDLLRRWRGREIDRSDGFLLLFAQAAEAVGYALDYRRVLAQLPVAMAARIGIHVGACVMRDNAADDVAGGAKPLEVDGIAKPVTARVMSIARGGQILLTAQARAGLDTQAHRIESHGHWQLKGVEEPIEVFEIGEADAVFLPPPDVPKAYRVLRRGDLWLPRREVRHSLPVERDAFIGRQDALRQLSAGFDAGSRLVSMVGAGGIGKTRLAQRFGWVWLGDFDGGVWFCDLAQARSLDGVVHAVASGLDLPLSGADAVAQIGDAIAGRGPCLVILDNFEQVVALAEATLGRWLDRAADARFLATSREVLGIVGERVLALDPMDGGEGAALFMRRAESARSDLPMHADERAAIAPLVALLDGLPLAIELAAARVRVMPPRELLRRMSERFDVLASKGGRPQRHVTLRATLDWSWDLLSACERAALAQWSVFEGGFDHDAARAVMDMSGHASPPGSLDLVQSLLDKSLLRATANGRFGLLRSVQEYAAEHLRTPGRFPGSGPEALDGAQRRHGAHFASFDVDHATSRGCADLDNLVAACRRAAARGDAGVAAGTLNAAWAALRFRGPFGVGSELALLCRELPGMAGADRVAVERVAGAAQQMCGRAADGRSHFDAGLRIARDIGDGAAEAAFLASIAEMEVYGGALEAAAERYATALQLARAAADPVLECTVLNGLGLHAEFGGNPALARVHYEAALALARQAGERRWEGGCLGNLGQLHANEGRPVEARRHYAQALEIARELGDRQWEGNALCNLGLLEQTEGELEAALHRLGAALEIAAELGHVQLECVVLCNIGLVHDAAGRHVEAQQKHLAAIAVARRLGDRRSEGQFLGYLGACQGRQGSFDAARASFEAGRALSEAVADRSNVALILCGRAEVECEAGDAQLAIRCFGEARSLAQELGAAAHSELGVALARVGARVGKAHRPDHAA